MLFTTSGGTGETAQNLCCDVKRAVGRVNNKINIYLHFCVFESVCHKNNIVFHAVRLQCWSKHWKSMLQASWLVDLWAGIFFFFVLFPLYHLPLYYVSLWVYLLPCNQKEEGKQKNAWHNYEDLWGGKWRKETKHWKELNRKLMRKETDWRGKEIEGKRKVK